MGLLTFYQANRQFILRSLTNVRSGSGREWYLSGNIFPDHWSPEYLKSYAQFFRCKSLEDAKYHRIAFEAGVQAVVRKWLLDGCREKTEEIAEILAVAYGL